LALGLQQHGGAAGRVRLIDAGHCRSEDGYPIAAQYLAESVSR